MPAAAVQAAEVPAAAVQAAEVPASKPTIRLATAVLAVLLTISGCTGMSEPDPAAPATGTRGSPGAASGTKSGAESGAEPAASADDLQLIRRLIERVNATAGSAPADQRAVLEQVVVTTRADDQRNCAPARTTVLFEPAWDDLRRDPGGADDTYVLPTLIRIYSADRVTGTDVTVLVISLAAGSAHLPPLCVA